MEWLAYSSDLNVMDNFWEDLIEEFYRDGKPFSSEEDLWMAINIAGDCVRASGTKKKKLSKTGAKTMKSFLRNKDLICHINHVLPC